MCLLFYDQYGVQCGVKQRKLVIQSFFPQSYTEFQTTSYVENYWFKTRVKEQKEMFIFDHLVDIRDEPARSGPPITFLTVYFSSTWKDTYFKFLQNTDIGFEIDVSG